MDCSVVDLKDSTHHHRHKSAAFHAALGATVCDANTNEHGSLGSVPSAISSPFVTPSPSQSFAGLLKQGVIVTVTVASSHAAGEPLSHTV
ncbi:MAG: hypothetical protein R2779_06795 [Crocinitomicaceae bacterium]